MSSIVTNNIWAQITKAARSSKGQSQVAVAYFGKGGAGMLPLKKGSKLVVDASELAVKSGQTCPAELIKLYKEGVLIYSYPQLHAKVYVINSQLFIGSSNVSGNSSHYLQEAVFKTADRNLIRDAKTFISSLCISELGYERLRKLSKIYRPPKFDPGKRLHKGKRVTNESLPNFFIYRFRFIEYPPGHEKPFAQGLKEAKSKRLKRVRHRLEDFQWKGKMDFKEGDTIVQIIKDGEKEMVFPPATIINIKKWNDDKNAFVYIEIPDKRKKNINTVAKSIDKSILKRGGKKNKQLAAEFAALWD